MTRASLARADRRCPRTLRAVRIMVALRLVERALSTDRNTVAECETATRARPLPKRARCEGGAPEGSSGAATAVVSPANAPQARPLFDRPTAALLEDRDAPQPVRLPRAKISLADVPSGMEALAARWRSETAAGQDAVECAQAEAEGLIFCKCGARRPGAQGGKVPAHFPASCIETDCPFRGSNVR